MNRYKAHQDLMNNFKLLAGQEIPGLRIFDRHVGMFYAKRIFNGVIDFIPVKINKVGMSDAYAYYKTNKGFIVAIEVEIKSGKAKQTKDQKNWENFITNIMGGKYFVVRDAREGVMEIKGYLKDLGLFDE